jgi:hypothetical protein
MKSIYLVGSLRNPEIPVIANEIEALGFEVFDNWFSAGKIADDSWKAYEQLRGRTYAQALEGYSARHVFEFDKKHLIRCDMCVLILPAGKSGHLELGVALGMGKKGYILSDDTADRWDVMYQFATGIFFSRNDLFNALRGENNEPSTTSLFSRRLLTEGGNQDHS